MGKKPIRLSNESCVIEIESQSGAIQRIQEKAAGIELITEPALSSNFNLCLSSADNQANYLNSNAQNLSKVEYTEHDVLLSWDGPLTNSLGAFELSVTVAIELLDKEMQFQITVKNDTDWKLTEVWYPILGGMTGLGDRKDNRMMVPLAGGSLAPESFNHFKGMVELGTQVPEMLFTYPGGMPMPWVDIYNPTLDRGVYFACHEKCSRTKTVRFALHPGIGHCRQDTWPAHDDVESMPTGMVINWICFPYAGRGELFEGPAVTLRFHEGDWHSAAALYRRWFLSHHKPSQSEKSWMHKETAFQNTMMLLPEGNVLWKFREIPRLAADAMEFGVRSILISGWNRGGHDNLYPCYEPDPKLGTWNDLADGIAKCHEMGARVFMFVNLHPMDCTTDWYKRELCKYAATDPWGCVAPYGYGMGTVAARLAYTRKPMVNAVPSFAGFRKIIVEQMKKLAKIGVDGLHIDKLAWGPALMFHPELNSGPDRANWEGVLAAVEEILGVCKRENPEFCISFEGAWDRMAEYSYSVWMWHSTWEKNHIPVLKYTFPDWIPCLPISQPFDYNIVNNAVRFGYQLFIGPANYTSSMKYRPMRSLSEYIREAVRIREQLMDTLYLGDFLDTAGIHVESSDDISYSVFVNRETRKKACVIVNFGSVPNNAKVAFNGNSEAEATIYEPFTDAKTVELPASIVIPPERFAVIAEKNCV